MAVALREQNGVDCWVCPYCSKDYPHVNEKGQEQVLPNRCARCGCPMDMKAAETFSEERARETHSPAFRLVGDTLRGGPLPTKARAKAAPPEEGV